MPTFTDIRQYSARELGPFHDSTAVTGSTVNSLLDTSWPIKSTNDQDSLYLDYFLHRPTATAADKARTVKTYTASAGQLVPDLSWDNAPSADEAYELLGVIEPIELERTINRVLKELMVVVEFTITPTADQTRHALPSGVATWLTDPRWIRQVATAEITEDRDEWDPFASDGRRVRGEAYRDGPLVYLGHPNRTFDPAQTVLYVKALKPAYYHCRTSDSGTWGERSGLAAEAHEAPLPEDLIAAATLVEIWRRHGKLLEPQANARLIKDRIEAELWKTQLTDLNLEVPDLTFVPPARRWGPRHTGGAWGW